MCAHLAKLLLGHQKHLIYALPASGLPLPLGWHAYYAYAFAAFAILSAAFSIIVERHALHFTARPISAMKVHKNTQTIKNLQLTATRLHDTQIPCTAIDVVQLEVLFVYAEN